NMENIVECRNLTHYYGDKMVYEDLNFNIKKGSILGLLGKNGTGKTTTINILNGYLTPRSGECIILGENSKNLSPFVKSQIGYLIENHVQYAFMNIYQIEKFYSGFYPNWKREAYYDLMAKLKVTPKQKISTMSCGQRSQVALGLILAQDPELL
uniref:ATP-binding cassette domain-containing protein n=1 Tax=uncultured Draconibacterium sp. TaxID=1573823 RepID=UPI00321669C2